MSAFLEYTQLVERKIARQLLSAIFATPGRSVVVNDGEEQTGLILNEMGVYPHLAHTDSDWIIVYDQGERLGGIWLVWGNGEDLITDYSDVPALCAIVDPIIEGR